MGGTPVGRIVRRRCPGGYVQGECPKPDVHILVKTTSLCSIAKCHQHCHPQWHRQLLQVLRDAFSKINRVGNDITNNVCYYRSGTDGRCSIGAGRGFVFTRQVATLCCALKWRHGCHLESVTSNRKPDYASIDAHLLEEHSCKISSRSDFKRRTVRFSWRVTPKRTRTRTTRWVAIWDQFLI